MNIPLEESIKNHLKRTRNPFEISKELSISSDYVRQAMRDLKLEPLPGWGRVDIQPAILSRRIAMGGAWPAHDYVRFMEHRRLHDQGRTTMCQGRDGDWIIQYSIETTGKPIRRNAYFYGG